MDQLPLLVLAGAAAAGAFLLAAAAMMRRRDPPPTGDDSAFAVSTEGMKTCHQCGMGNLWTERTCSACGATLRG